MDATPNLFMKRAPSQESQKEGDYAIGSARLQLLIRRRVAIAKGR